MNALSVTPVASESRPGASLFVITTPADCPAAVSRAQIGDVLVLAASVPVGTTRRLLADPLAARGLEVGAEVFVAHATGSTIGAVTTNCLERASRALQSTLQPVSSPEASELVALHRAAAIVVEAAVADELAEAARAFGVDPLEAAAAAGTARPGARPPLEPLIALLRHRMPVLEHSLGALQGRPGRIADRLARLLAARGADLRTARVLVIDGSRGLGEAVLNELAGRGATADIQDPCGRRPPDVTPYDAVVVCRWPAGEDRRWLDGAALVLDCTYAGPSGHARYTA